MNRYLEMLLIPLIIFVAALFASFGILVLFGSATIVGAILKAITNWLLTEFPFLVSQTLNDPWKVLALPIAVGIVILFYQWAIEEFWKGSEAPVLRGRRMGDSRSHRNRSRPHEKPEGNGIGKGRNKSNHRRPDRFSR